MTIYKLVRKLPRRYVDNIFLLFCSTERVAKFKKYLSKEHRNIDSTSKIEKKCFTVISGH